MSEISDLFAKDPLLLTKEDRSKIIAQYRANRAAYLSGEKVTKAKAKAKPKPTLDIGEIEVEI